MGAFGHAVLTRGIWGGFFQYVSVLVDDIFNFFGAGEFGAVVSAHSVPMLFEVEFGHKFIGEIVGIGYKSVFAAYIVEGVGFVKSTVGGCGDNFVLSDAMLFEELINDGDRW